MDSRMAWASLIGVIAVLVPRSSGQTTLWVDKDKPGDDTFAGTQASPYATIGKALSVVNGGSGFYVIKIVDANYTQAHEETFAGGGFPLEITHDGGVAIEGVDSAGNPASVSAYPRIGGDLIDEQVAASALVEIIVDETTGDINGVEVRRLRFLGENETGADSPVALRMTVTDEMEVSDFVFEHNLCGRPFQNESGTEGQATIHVEAQNGTVSSSSISNNVIDCSNRAGVEVIAKAGNGESAGTSITLAANVISNPNAGAADFGILWHGQNASATAPDYKGLTAITHNVIIGRGDALQTGVAVICDERTDFKHLNFSDNVVTGCAGNGVVLSVDGWAGGPSTQPEIALTTCERNRITGNGGSGVVLIWDRNGADDGKGYLHFSAVSSLIADNEGYGIEVRGLGGESVGSFALVNCTIVYNVLGGEGFSDLQSGYGDVLGDEITWTHLNCIMYENNSNGDQLIGFQTDPTTLAALLSGVSYSDWKGINTSGTNIDADPRFVNVGRHDYHLDVDPASPCIDAGLNISELETKLDIDSEVRIQDGDDDNDPVVDMGSDEVPED